MKELIDKIKYLYFEVENEEIIKFVKKIDKFLKEKDEFDGDVYEKIFNKIYMVRIDISQEKIGEKIGMNQATISRKIRKINRYVSEKVKKKIV